VNGNAGEHVRDLLARLGFVAKKRIGTRVNPCSEIVKHSAIAISVIVLSEPVDV
jgi:hypothetical protein